MVYSKNNSIKEKLVQFTVHKNQIPTYFIFTDQQLNKSRMPNNGNYLFFYYILWSQFFCCEI